MPATRATVGEGSLELSDRFRVWVVVTLSMLVCGCFAPAASLPRGEQAYDLVPAANPATPLPEYRIGILDTLSIRVFQEPELSFDEIVVNTGGSINFPLIGEVTAAGRTPLELSSEIGARLGERFIRSPQVVVGVAQAAGQRVTVDGSVVEPGVYEIEGGSSLIEAIARAKGLTRVAVVNEIVVLRTIDGQPMGAVFDLQAIREGKAPDPVILGGDKIIVGFSGLKGAYQDLMNAAPLFNIFRAL